MSIIPQKHNRPFPLFLFVQIHSHYLTVKRKAPLVSCSGQQFLPQGFLKKKEKEKSP